MQPFFQFISKDKKIQSLVDKIIEKDGEVSIVSSADCLRDLLLILRDDERYLFKILLDICGVDYPDREKRFEVVYHLLSIENNLRLRIKVSVDESEFLPSINDIYSSANWYEREAWDMYGILFYGNDDLRRILTDYGFSGHPMRKDFPLSGHVEIKYDVEKEKVIYEPVKLVQEYRDFNFQSPWEGEKYLLPGDEKANKK
ncbi:MAG: NADH-quinone oxidoreductase subunit C [Candidatus Midichloriaceae bacterium]|jgi:NADH-quinone oxidoreductase subunit C